MKAKLISPDALQSDWEIPLDDFPVVIGRSGEAEIQPADPQVSDLHCVIDEVNGQLQVRDLESERGTFVNDKRIEVAPLLPGDKLTVAAESFVASYALDERRTSKTRRGEIEGGRQLCEDENAELDSVTTFVGLYKLIEKQRRAYRDHFGNDLPVGDPIFPDPPHPEHLEHMFVGEMRQAGEDPAVIYAFEQTGLLVTEFNRDSLTSEQRTNWEAALDEYDDRHDRFDGESEFPVGAVILRGPDKTTTTLVAATVIVDEDEEPIERRWVGSGVKEDSRVIAEIRQFFATYCVNSVVMLRENVGCPHDEGRDYPVGEDCPFCPAWKGKQ